MFCERMHGGSGCRKLQQRTSVGIIAILTSVLVAGGCHPKQNGNQRKGVTLLGMSQLKC